MLWRDEAEASDGSGFRRGHPIDMSLVAIAPLNPDYMPRGIHLEQGSWGCRAVGSDRQPIQAATCPAARSVMHHAPLQAAGTCLRAQEGGGVSDLCMGRQRGLILHLGLVAARHGLLTKSDAYPVAAPGLKHAQDVQLGARLRLCGADPRRRRPGGHGALAWQAMRRRDASEAAMPCSLARALGRPTTIQMDSCMRVAGREHHHHHQGGGRRGGAILARPLRQAGGEEVH